MLNRNGDGLHSGLDLGFVGKILKCFTINNEFCCSLVFFCLFFFLFAVILEIYLLKDNFFHFIFTKCYSASFEKITWFFSLNLEGW